MKEGSPAQGLPSFNIRKSVGDTAISFYYVIGQISLRVHIGKGGDPMAKHEHYVFKIKETYPENGPVLVELESCLLSWMEEVLEQARLQKMNRDSPQMNSAAK